MTDPGEEVIMYYLNYMKEESILWDKKHASIQIKKYTLISTFNLMGMKHLLFNICSN